MSQARQQLQNKAQPPASIKAFSLERSGRRKLFKFLALVVQLIRHIESVILQGGVLLGAIRSGAIIKHDDDIDFFVHVDDRAALRSIRWEEHGLRCEQVATGHVVVSYLGGGEELRCVRGSVLRRSQRKLFENVNKLYACELTH